MRKERIIKLSKRNNYLDALLSYPDFNLVSSLYLSINLEPKCPCIISSSICLGL